MIKLNEYNGCEIEGNYFDEQDIVNLTRLQIQLLKEEKIIATIEECANIWQKYSSDLSASWLDFPEKDENILNHIKSSDYFDNFENYSK